MATRYKILTTKDYPETGLQKGLTPVALKTGNYTANANELVPCDATSASFAITLPTAPADGTRVEVQVVAIGGTNDVEVKCGGTDKLWTSTGPVGVFLSYDLEFANFQYQSSTGIWFADISAVPYNFANNFVGIDSTLPITNADISINTTTRVLSIVPPTGNLRFFVDGNGRVRRLRKSGTVTFPAFADTSGAWYFYFNATGTAVTTQTPWVDFNIVVPVYRLLWNKNLFKFTVTSATATLGDTYTNNSSTFTVKETISGGTTLICERTAGANDPSASGNLVRTAGAGTNPIVFSAWNSDAKLVAQYIEYHQNTIPADTHQLFHLEGSKWVAGLSNASNELATTDPNTDGRNTVIALTTGTVADENLPYTITNSTAGTAWTQDLGNTTPASLNATNSALFKIFTQNTAGEVSFLPATRFPFAWDVATNRPETISSVGVRTVVPDNRWFVYFVYSTQNPVAGEAIEIVSAPSEFTSLANAQAYTWSSIQSLYSVIGMDNEIRPLYRLIFYNDNSGGGAFPAGCKYSVIREIADLRKGSVTSNVSASGSLPASAVTVVASGSLGTNAQSSLENLDANKLPLAGGTMTGSLVVGSETSGQNITVTGTLGAEMVPSFDPANWTATNGWSADGAGTQLTRVNNATGGNINPSGVFNVVAGRTYKVVITASAVTGLINYTVGSGTGQSIVNGTITDYVVAASVGKLTISGAAGAICVINSVSVKEIDPSTGVVNANGFILNGAISNNLRTTRYNISPFSGVHIFTGSLSGTAALTIAGAFSGATTGSFSNILTTSRLSTGVTSSDGINVIFASNATVGTPVQMSPRIRISGSVWDTGGTPQMKTCNFKNEVLPISGNPGTSRLLWGYDYNGGGYTELMNLTSGGNMGMGVTAPTARIHIMAGTAAANTAPLQFTSGVNETSPRDGLLEYDGTAFYLTIGSVRDKIVLNNLSATLTEKRVNPRLVTAASYTTDTGTSLNVATCDQFEITAQAGALKFNNPGGTPLGGQKLIIRIKDNGTARALTYDTQFRAMGSDLPSTTVLSKTLYLGLIFNATDTKWDLVAPAQEA